MIFEVRGASFGYTPENSVLEKLDYRSQSNVISILAGVNGCGKSTLLKLLAGLMTPDEGEILLDGVPLKNIPRRELAKKVAYLPQNPVVPESFTVSEFLDCVRYNLPVSKAAVSRAAEETGITHLLNNQLALLSGGEKQRVFLAFVLARETEVLLLDEPFSALDPAAFRELFTLLIKLKENRKLSVIVTLHDINRALVYGERIIGLKDRKIFFDLPPAEAVGKVPELYELPETSVVTKTFFV